VGREVLALDDGAAPVRRVPADVGAAVSAAAVDLDAGASVAAQEPGDVLLELTPVHGVHGRHPAAQRALRTRLLRTVQPRLVLGERL
jgi:hypothetical protein